MRSVMFENRNAIFDFDLPDVIDRLKYYSDQNVHEATKILNTISLCHSPTIKVETDYFGYIVLDLIKANKGHVYCKACKKGFRTQRGRKTQDVQKMLNLSLLQIHGPLAKHPPRIRHFSVPRGDRNSSFSRLFPFIRKP